MQEDLVAPAPLLAPPPAAASPAGPQRSTLSSLAYWARDLVLSVIIAIIVILFLYQPVKVEGTSMMPALTDQERIFINKFVYRFHIDNIERGDMIVFWYPNDPSKSYIKRVVGVPGDHIEVDRGTVVVNGKALEESYVPLEYRDDMSMTSKTIPSDEFFVLGDHRSSSNDSRSWGTVPRRYIYGKAVFVYWPLDRVGLLR